MSKLCRISWWTAALLLLNLHIASSAPLALQAVTVTGERNNSNLLKTAASVEVIDAKFIDHASGANSVKQLIVNTGNINSSASVGAPIIRGQDTQGPNYGAGAFWGGTVPRAAINYDGRLSDYNELFFGISSVWDVERIELFRGPQTTSQGANSIAGAIIVKTFDPTFTPEYKASLQYGSRNKQNYGLVASTGLYAEQLAARLALNYAMRDSFIEFSNPKFNPGRADTRLSHSNLRAKFLYLPSAMPEFEAKVTLSRASSEGPQLEFAHYPYAKLQNRDTALISWPMHTEAIIVDTRYEADAYNYWVNQLQYSQSDIERVYNPQTMGGALIDKYTWGNEMRWHFGRPSLNAYIGWYLQQIEADERLFMRGLTAFKDSKRQFGLFAKLQVAMAAKWDLSLSSRLQYDSVERQGSTVFVKQNGGALQYSGRFGDLLPKVELAYKPTSGLVVGSSIAKGYNPGGIGLSMLGQKFVEFVAENVWNYELFMRAELMEQRLNLRGNLFYSDYDNTQRNVVSAVPMATDLIESITVNAERANSYGLELAASYQVLANLQLSSSIGWLHTEFLQFDKAKFDFVGKRFAKAPNYNFNLAANYQLGKWQLNGNWRHIGSYFSEDENLAENKSLAYSLVNARLAYQISRELQIFAYVNNIADKITPTWQRAAVGKSPQMAQMSEPREFGLGLNASW